jgi:hypothetical protein
VFWGGGQGACLDGVVRTERGGLPGSKSWLAVPNMSRADAVVGNFEVDHFLRLEGSFLPCRAEYVISLGNGV